MASTTSLASSAAVYETRAGDTLDYICHLHYGSTSGRQVELVMEVNPGLADRGPVLPAGVRIALPKIIPPIRETVRLFS